MHFEDSFGVRQSPSLAEAMRHTPQLGQQWVYSSAGSTPNNLIQTGIKSNVGSSSQQLIEPILRCSPTVVEPSYSSQPPQLINPFDQSLEEIEKKLCIQLDETLRMNYKKMKNKIKKVKYRVQQTDGSIHRIQELIESVYEHIDEIDQINATPNPIIMQEASPNNSIAESFINDFNQCNYNPPFVKTPKKITWRRSVNQNKKLDISDQ